MPQHRPARLVLYLLLGAARGEDLNAVVESLFSGKGGEAIAALVTDRGAVTAIPANPCDTASRLHRVVEGSDEHDDVGAVAIAQGRLYRAEHPDAPGQTVERGAVVTGFGVRDFHCIHQPQGDGTEDRHPRREQ